MKKKHEFASVRVSCSVVKPNNLILSYLILSIALYNTVANSSSLGAHVAACRILHIHFC